MEDGYTQTLNRIIGQNSVAENHVVYWLYDDSCRSSVDEGYVGVTKETRFKTRMLEHKRHRKNFNYRILFTYDCSEYAYVMEYTLRPHSNIGWNIAPGGAKGRSFGIPKTQETKDKIGAGNKGNARNDLSEFNRRQKGVKRPIKKCIHCCKTGSDNSIARFHLDNCLLNENNPKNMLGKSSDTSEYLRLKLLGYKKPKMSMAKTLAKEQKNV